jgi:lipoprotein-releasing system ATP-binding protein
MEAPLVSARGLAKAYRTPAGSVRVLEGLDLEVAAGERVAIVGASGVGKSTLLHVLGTLDRADAGSLAIDGSEVFALSEPARCAFRNRTLGFVFQFHHLLPEFTALENVAMPLLVARRPLAFAEARARELLGEVGLSERADHRPGMLSGGEQQRVAVARALAGSPRLLLADEPTGDLDAGTGERLAQLLMELARARGLTIVLATHNAALAASCDRVLRLSRGRLEPLGSELS